MGGCVALPSRSKSEENEGIRVRMGAQCVLKVRCASGSEPGTITVTVSPPSQTLSPDNGGVHTYVCTDVCHVVAD